MSTADELAHDYIAAWSTPDAQERRQLIDLVYAADAEFFADEPGDEPLRCRGRAEIMQNITRVNQRLTQGAGLATTRTGLVENHDLVRVSWSMTTPAGDVALRGMNLLLRNGEGRIVRDYILIG